MTPADAAARDHRHELEPSPRWVRVRFGGQFVADSRRVLLLREPGRIPVYYFPRADVRADALAPAGHAAPCARDGGAACWSVRGGDRTAEHAAWSYPDPPAERLRLRDHVTFEWPKMDAWFEEDDEVYVHARDPYKRVDVLHSSRHVRVEVGGTVVADTRRPSVLFETGRPTRYYVPRADVRMDLLEPTATETQCPYKGVANYYSVRAGDAMVRDIAWYYRHPIQECGKIENLISFFDERVDLYVDGALQARPQTRWSASATGEPAAAAARAPERRAD